MARGWLQGLNVPREWPALCPQYGDKEAAAAAWQFSRSTGFGARPEEGSHADSALLTPLLRAANAGSGHSWQALSIGSPSGSVLVAPSPGVSVFLLLS